MNNNKKNDISNDSILNSLFGDEPVTENVENSSNNSSTTKDSNSLKNDPVLAELFGSVEEEQLAPEEKLTKAPSNNISTDALNNAESKVVSSETQHFDMSSSNIIEKSPNEKKTSDETQVLSSLTEADIIDSKNEVLIEEAILATNSPKRKPQSKVKMVLKYAFLLCLAGVLYIGFFAANVVSATPEIDPTTMYSTLNSSSTLYDDQGAKLETLSFGEGSRVLIDYEEIPENMINAIVAIEDKTFWEHSGFNFIRIFGAIFESLVGGGDISGTSTLTQQLARNVYLPETMSIRSYSRKISEAYYAMQIEQSLTKEEIVEAYLNTVFLGYNSYGIEAASQAYYGKPASQMTLEECVALAAIPKSPTAFALVEQVDTSNITTQIDPNSVLDTSSNFVYVYNGDESKDRRELILYNMKDQGYIDEATEQAAIAADLKSHIHVTTDQEDKVTAYFGDYAINEVQADLVAEGYTEQQAAAMVYGGGLHIYTTLNQQAQNAILEEYENSSNFPYLTSIPYDGNNNITDTYGNVILEPLDRFISDDVFTLTSSEYTFDDAGNMILYANKRLSFIETTVNGAIDYSVEFPAMYDFIDGTLHTIENGFLLIPQEYKTLNSDGNLVIDASFFTEGHYPNFFVKSGTSYVVSDGSYLLKQAIVQPQSAMVITDYKNGEIKAMVGGRGTSGSMLYNRATSPRQPGSSIKPLSTYSLALQKGAEAAETGTPMTFATTDSKDQPEYIGDYWTASSYINDAALNLNGTSWPKNSYGGYRGLITMRNAVTISSNAATVRAFNMLGATEATEHLEKMGISTIVDSDEDVNDQNPAALALGGMTVGISPQELSAAYGIFGNEGVYVEPISYTKVTDNNGDEVLDRPEQTKTQVIDPGVAYIMRDIMFDVVTSGTGTAAGIYGTQVSGKTGTTDNNFDIWFAGITPQYSAAVWIGSDVNIKLTSASYMAASLWSDVMSDAIAGMGGEYSAQPSNVIYSNGEYYVTGTNKNLKKPGTEVTVCNVSGYVATPWCTDTSEEILDEDDEKGKYYCNVHNTGKYEIAPGATLNPNFVDPDAKPEEEEEDKEDEETPTPEPEDPETTP